MNEREASLSALLLLTPSLSSDISTPPTTRVHAILQHPELVCSVNPGCPRSPTFVFYAPSRASGNGPSSAKPFTAPLVRSRLFSSCFPKTHGGTSICRATLTFCIHVCSSHYKLWGSALCLLQQTIVASCFWAQLCLSSLNFPLMHDPQERVLAELTWAQGH